MARTADNRIVYVVDDDESVRRGLARLLRSAGHTPQVYASAEHFLAEVGDTPCACVLLDITMPHMTGLQVQASLNERGIDIPVIAVSARDDEETRQAARDFGARFFLCKPVDDHALLDAIAWVMASGDGHG